MKILDIMNTGISGIEKLAGSLNDGVLQECAISLEAKRFPVGLSRPFVFDEEFEKGGVYLFYVNLGDSGDRLSDIPTIWREIKALPGTRPDLSTVALSSVCQTRNTWIPFYLGKAQDLQSRVMDHVNYQGGKTKHSSLRLIETFKTARFFKDWRFSVAMLPLEFSHDSYCLCELLERKLRHHIRPIIGHQ